MEYKIPKKGEIYKHFRDGLYEIVFIARDSVTLEEKVVYKEVDGDAAFVDSLSMFIQPVDKKYYPNAEQEFRFELVSDKNDSAKTCKTEEIQKEDIQKEDAQEGCSLDQEMIMAFLDLSTAEDKIHYLQSVRDHINEKFIGIVAHSLDFVENEGDLQQRYWAIIQYLRTVVRYESARLR